MTILQAIITATSGTIGTVILVIVVLNILGTTEKAVSDNQQAIKIQQDIKHNFISGWQMLELGGDLMFWILLIGAGFFLGREIIAG